MKNDLLTIADIARALDLPESTARYYRDRFAPWVPSVGEGRRRRYRPEALDVLRTIAEGLRNNRTATEVADLLSRMYPTNADTAIEPQQPTAAAQQSGPGEASGWALVALAALGSQQETLKRIADQQQELERLRAELVELQKHQEASQTRLTELEARITAAQVPWWRRWF